MADADEVFSLWVRVRDNYTCVFCGRSKANGYMIQCSHFWGRGNKTTRFDPLNADALCAQCHMAHEGNKQGYYRDFKVGQLGKKGYAALEKKARSIGKLSSILAQFELDFLA